MPDRIADNVVVTLDYQLFDEDNELLEDSSEDGALIYLHGYENIIPGLERELTGLRVGDKKSIVVSPEEGYGEYEEDAVETFAFADLPEGIQGSLEVGMLLEIVDDEDMEMVAEVVEINEDGVVLDFNHPLAGETLRFEVTVSELRDASDEEIEHGHAHYPEGYDE
ncbi:MAG: peptidylprolyl isomerase [Anaerolineae bacterium]|nr:peptidylprolyl isomerase [Anaerolineae bacterium]